MKTFKLIAPLILLVIACVFPLISPNASITSIAIFTLIFASAATGWNIFGGYTGYFSLGFGTYYGFGAYTLALACKAWHIPGGYLPFTLLPLAGLVAALMAIPLGWIALRTRKETFIVITLATLFVFQLLAYNAGNFTGGSGGTLLPFPDWTGDFFNYPFYYVALVLLLFSLALSWCIRRSKFGLGLLAIRDDEDRVLSLGVRTGRYKLSAFVISAFIGGMTGAISAYISSSIGPEAAFSPGINTLPAVMALLGGIGTLAGPILGACIIIPLEQAMNLLLGSVRINGQSLNIDGLNLVLDGLLILFVLIFMPAGILPTLRKAWRRRQSKAQTEQTSKPEEPLLAESGAEGAQG